LSSVLLPDPLRPTMPKNSPCAICTETSSSACSVSCVRLANGEVSVSGASCKFFPEFVIGDLWEQSVEDVWQGEAFRRVRTTLRGTSLMPVCSKCILLYLNGV